MSTQSLTGFTRGSLVGGVMVDNFHGSQLELSRAAEQAARRATLIKEARKSGAPTAGGVSRWTTWLLSGVRHRSSGAPESFGASANC